MDRGKGPFVKVKLSYSEVCCHMRVAGQEMYVRDVGHHMCQLYRCVEVYEGDHPVRPKVQYLPFSFPITWGEAGVTEEMFAEALTEMEMDALNASEGVRRYSGHGREE